MNDNVKYTLDAVAVANVIATIVGWLPAIAAIFSIVWTVIQIYTWYKKR